MKKTLRNTTAAILVSAVSATAALADSAKEVAVAEMSALFVTFDAAAAEKVMAKDLIQHNPSIPSGSAPLIGFIPALKESGISATTHRLISEGDLVVAHNEYKNAKLFGGDHLVAFDVFRIKDGKVAEHWDNITAFAKPNPSGRTQLDGTTKITDLDKTAENKAMVTDFMNTVMIGGDGSRITDFISTETYLQHNSGVADGLSALGDALAAMAANGQPMTYSKTHIIVAEGNFVFAASEGSFLGKPSAFYDLFRIDGGKVVEHWDVITDMPTKSANDNGKF